MHAYASKDPVFLAMNARGQRETNGELGGFCVKCHAPLALLSGQTTDGLNLSSVSEEFQGVSCVFCHQITGTTEAHNAGVTLAQDNIMRGGIFDPISTDAHGSEGSVFHERTKPDSSQACGSCHDVVLQNGFHLEKTYKEWQASIFSRRNKYIGQSCIQCHMQGSDGIAAQVEGAPQRRIHKHSFAGIDLAMISFPQKVEQKTEVQSLLDSSLVSFLCVPTITSSLGKSHARIDIAIENLTAGHAFPSGVAHDRRVWVEIEAFQKGQKVFESKRDPTRSVKDHSENELLWFGEKAFTKNNQEALMFFEVNRVESKLLPVAEGLPGEVNYRDRHIYKNYDVNAEFVDRVELRVYMESMPFEVLQSLSDSGDLDLNKLEPIPKFEIRNAALTWTSTGSLCVPTF